MYSTEVSLKHRKKYGQFFTPENVAEMMSDWIFEKLPSTILDPCVGTGVFPEISRSRKYFFSFDCFDVDPVILAYAENKFIGNPKYRFIQSDFLKEDVGSYDAIVMNPPYLKHQDILHDKNIYESISAKYGCHIPKTSNIYVLFTIKACELLKDNGRAAIIIPSEWMQTNYGMFFKKYLLENGLLKKVIWFSSECRLFENATTTACVLLLEKNDNNQDSVSFEIVDNIRDGDVYDEVAKRRMSFGVKRLLNEKKWESLFNEDSFTHPVGWISLSELAKVKRGIVTGSKKYFLFSKKDIKASKISEDRFVRCIGNAFHAKFHVLRSSDIGDDVKSWLLMLTDELKVEEMKYVKKGERQKVNSGYILSKRSPWYSMENRSPSPILFPIFMRNGMRFIRNIDMMYYLSTFYGVYPDRTDVIFLNALLVVLNSEIVRKSALKNLRSYGNGLVKMEPSDLLDMMIPDLRKFEAKDLEYLSDQMNILGADYDWSRLDDFILDRLNS